MIWIIILAVITGFLCWLLFSPLRLEVDTRVPQAGLKWLGIGSFSVWDEEEWWLSMRIFFYRKTMKLSEIKVMREKKDGTLNKKWKRAMNISRMMTKMISVIKTFRVTEWELAIDSGDYSRNAQVYPLNFLPHTFEHLYINFRNENYLLLKIRNRPWKILYSLLR